MKRTAMQSAWARWMGMLLAGVLVAPAVAEAGEKTVGPAKPRVAAPKGFAQMRVAGLMPSRGGNAVILSDQEQNLLLPIWIGDAEAFSIQMRLDRRRFQRPLTHDLLDNVMRELGGRLIKIHVDGLKGSTFVGTVFVQQEKRLIEVDARPSDAIALAVGNRAPIFVSRKVLEQAGVRKDDSEPSPQKDPETLLKDILKGDREEHTL